MDRVMSRDKLLIIGVVVLGLLGFLVYKQQKKDEAIAEAIAVIKRWRVAAIDAAGLGRGLVQARARLPLVRQLCCDRSSPDEDDRADCGRRQAARVLRSGA